MMPPKSADLIQTNVIAAMKLEFDKFKIEFDNMKRELIQQMDAKDDEIKSLKDVVTELRNKVSKMEETIDDSEVVARQNQVTFSGVGIPSFTNDENTPEVVKNTIKNVLKLRFNDQDLSCAYRIGPKPKTQRPDNRKILVTFNKKETKIDLLKACKNIKPNFYVNENLTPRRSTILYALRMIKKSHSDILKGCASYDGKVYAYHASSIAGQSTSRDLRTLINSHSCLTNFCREVIKVPLTHFLPEWTH